MKITNAKERAQFRTTPAWQILRRYLCAARNMTCEFCGVQYKRMSDLNVHHMYTTNYDNLAQDRFMLLCKTCHEFIHHKYKSPLLRDRKLFGRED
jgi:hypothetical protein